MSDSEAIVVVKIGGSLAEDSRLVDWLERISAARQHIVIVPGGGVFADQVRKLQARWRFTDRTAHYMAILAMQQFGMMLADLGGSEIVLAKSAGQVKNKLKLGASPVVWLPDLMELQRDQVAENWALSADSLAVWLCSKLGAQRLILIKSADMSQYTDCPIAVLQENHIVDKAFGQMMETVHCSFSVLGKDQLDLFGRLLR